MNIFRKDGELQISLTSQCTTEAIPECSLACCVCTFCERLVKLLGKHPSGLTITRTNSYHPARGVLVGKSPTLLCCCCSSKATMRISLRTKKEWYLAIISSIHILSIVFSTILDVGFHQHIHLNYNVLGWQLNDCGSCHYHLMTKPTIT